MSELISVAQAQALIARHMPRFDSERVPLDEAVGRVLRQRVLAERDQPAFHRVMMDGIGVLWQQPMPPRLALAGQQLAGMTEQRLPAGDFCIEVTTGAMLPGGCDCVIPVEQTARDDDAYALRDGYAPTKNQYIHQRGSDCTRGVVLLEEGVRLRGPELGVLAANGVAEVEVAAVPAIAVVSTGDELVDVDAVLREGQIRRSNDRALAASLRSHGLHRITLAQVVDDLQATTEALGELIERHPVVVLSGGVSMGQRDYVPAALQTLGVRKVFHRIAQRPGKPMWFGVAANGHVVFGLPGNPVSALVGVARYVRPAIEAAMGATDALVERVALDSAVEVNPALTCFVPARVENDASGRAVALALPVNTSGDFSALPHTHGFVQLAQGPSPVPAGTVVSFYRW